MPYDPKFDAKRPQPGDKELAAAIKKGIEDAKKGREAKLSPQQLERLFERSKEFTSTAERLAQKKVGTEETKLNSNKDGP